MVIIINLFDFVNPGGKKMKEKNKKAELGKRIKDLRTENGLSQKDLADFLGIGRPNLSRIERGYILPVTPYLIKLRDRFNVSIDWLLNGESPTQDKITLEKDVKLLLEYFEKVPRVKHAVLGFFFEYLEKFQISKENLQDERYEGGK